MQFIRDVLIISSNEEFSSSLNKELSALTSKLRVDTVTQKPDVSSKLAGKTMTSVVLNMPILNDNLYVLKQLEMYKHNTNPELSIFFTNEDFNTFQLIVKDEEFKFLNIVPWPVEAKEMAKKIHDHVFQNKISKQVVRKGENLFNLDLEFVQVFIEATKSVITEMGQISHLKNLKPVLKENLGHPLEEGIASKIMISSEYFKGNFYAVFPEKTYLKLYENVVYEEHSEINDENRDFAGELANIIFGNAKKVFSASGLNLDMAIPSIHNSSNIESELVIIIPFESDVGQFYIVVAPGNL